MEIVEKQNTADFEAYVSSSPMGSFMQSVNWAKVKNNWGYEAILSRGGSGEIKGAVLVLIQKIGMFSFLYAPRGPVCDLSDEETLADLTKGICTVAKQYHAHTFTMDPDVTADNQAFIDSLKRLGYVYNKGGDNFELIQPRFNYRLFLRGRTEEELFANLTQKTRYNTRVAIKKGVEIKVCGKEQLGEFVRIMRVTGERDGFNTRPQSYFERFLDAMGDHVRLYMGFYEGKAVCGAITTNYAGKVCYVYGASDNVYRNVMPNYLMQWEMIRWAVETNATVYDFQGVSGVLDESNPLYGLYRFKSGFNGDVVELAGEFNLVFKPFVARCINFALEKRDQMRHKKKKAAAK